MPSCSSTTKSCGSTCRISRPVGSETALAASIARRTSSRVISRFLPATAITPRLLNPLMCGPDRARCTESISTPAISSASSIAFLIESTAVARFTTTPRRMPRDSATPSPTMSSPPASSISPTTAVTFEVPTSSPTRYRSLRATLPPDCCLSPADSRPPARSPRLSPRERRSGRSHRPHVDPIAEPQIHVVDLLNPLPQRLREIDIGLQAGQKSILPHVEHRRIPAQDHGGVVQIADVNLRQPSRNLGSRSERRDQSRGELGTRRVRRSASAPARPAASGRR